MNFDKQGIEELETPTLGFSELSASKTNENIYCHGNDEVKFIVDDNLLNLLNFIAKPYKDNDVNFIKHINELRVYNGDFDGKTLNTFVLEFCKFQNTCFENMTFSNVVFTHSAFNNCYFRNVLFYNCDFSNVKIFNCDHESVTYEGCYFGEICHFSQTPVTKVVFRDSTHRRSEHKNICFEKSKI